MYKMDKTNWNKLCIISAVILLLALSGVLYLHNQSKEVAQQIFPSEIKFCGTFFAKKCDNSGEYFVTVGDTANRIYEYFEDKDLQQTNSAVLGDWQYKLIFSKKVEPLDTLSSSGLYVIPNDIDDIWSVVEVYRNYIMIDGTTYTYPDYEATIYQWFCDYYENNAGNYPNYISHE